jgi:hypothetical protein
MPNKVVHDLIVAVAKLQADMTWVKRWIYVSAGAAITTLMTVLFK